VRATGRPGTTALFEERPHSTSEPSSHSSSVPSRALGDAGGPCRSCNSTSRTPSGLMLTIC
jgi:hypothetical protein